VIDRTSDYLFVGGAFEEKDGTLGNNDGTADLVLGIKCIDRNDGTDYWMFGYK